MKSLPFLILAAFFFLVFFVNQERERGDQPMAPCPVWGTVAIRALLTLQGLHPQPSPYTPPFLTLLSLLSLPLPSAGPGWPDLCILPMLFSVADPPPVFVVPHKSQQAASLLSLKYSGFF